MEYVVWFGVFLLGLISLIHQGLCQDSKPVTTPTTTTTAVVHVQDNTVTEKSNLPPERGILCYVCNSKGDPNCGDKQWNPHFVKLVNCTEQLYMNDYETSLIKKIGKSQPYICRKQVQKVSLGKKTDTRVVRSCGFMPQHKRYAYEDDDDFIGEDRCYTRHGTFEVMATYCACTKDKCNDGNRFGMKSWISLAISSTFVLLQLPLGHSQ